MVVGTLLLNVNLWTAAVASSIVSDQFTSERVLRLNGTPDRGHPGNLWEIHETNPTPGMQTFGGRLAWHAAELGAITWGLRSKKPAVRWIARGFAVASVFAHVRGSFLNVQHRSLMLKGAAAP